MKPIPKKLLRHSAKLCSIVQDKYGEETVMNETLLEYVRVEPSGSLVKSRDNTQIKLSARLFFDCKNSQPNECVFLNTDKIEFKNNYYDIIFIELFYDENKPHHYEFGLAL